MICDYVTAAMRRATYELLADGEGFFAHVTELPGAWANAPTLEACREELHEVIQEWLWIKLRHNDADFAVLDGIDLNPRPAEAVPDEDAGPEATALGSGLADRVAVEEGVA